MANEQVFLYRLRLFKTAQLPLFEYNNRSQIFKSIFSNPDIRFESYGSTWRFGNYAEIDNNWIYFRTGKVQKEKSEEFVEGDFDDVLLDKGVSTKILLDTNKGILGIYYNSNLAQNAKTVGS